MQIRVIWQTIAVASWLSIAAHTLTGVAEAEESCVHGWVFGQEQNGDHIGPVSGAKVTLLSSKTKAKLSATVSDTGYYQIENVEPGQYTYSISANGYRTEDESRGIEFAETGAHVLDFVLTRDVPEANGTTKPSGSQRMGELIVRVLEDAGNGQQKPAEGAQVSVRGEGTSDLFTANCDAAGLCRFSLGKGNVRLRASSPDGNTRSTTGTASVNLKSSTTVELVLVPKSVSPEKSVPASETETTFFGTKGKGESVVYLVDNSLSMKNGKFERASAELLRSIENLSPNQKFYVIFFSDTLHPMYEPDAPQRLVSVNKLNIERLREFTENLRLVRQTNARPALEKAFSFNPDVIYILSDGAFTDDTRSFLLDKPAGNTAIHTISITPPQQRAARTLKAIAERHGGTYTEVP